MHIAVAAALRLPAICPAIGASPDHVRPHMRTQSARSCFSRHERGAGWHLAGPRAHRLPRLDAVAERPARCRIHRSHACPQVGCLQRSDSDWGAMAASYGEAASSGFWDLARPTWAGAPLESSPRRRGQEVAPSPQKEGLGTGTCVCALTVQSSEH